MVLIDESAGAFTEKSITIDGGPGRDTPSAARATTLILGGDDDDFVDANRGNDTSCSARATTWPSGTRGTATT